MEDLPYENKFGTWYYTVDGAITGFVPADGVTKAETPKDIKGIPIKKINDGAFGSFDLALPPNQKKQQAWSYLFLKELVIHDGVEELGSGCFFHCPGLEKLTIPKSVTKVGKFLFAYCPNLKTIIVGDDIKELRNQESITLNGNTILKREKHSDTVFGILNKDIEIASIPGDVKEIAANAFYMCKRLRTVNIENGVKKIGDNAFLMCFSLLGMTIPGSVKEIGDNAFGWCGCLLTLDILEGVRKIGNNAFNKCINLQKLNIPKSVREIGKNAFGGCEKLETVNIGNGVEKIGENAFDKCFDLQEVTIPGSVKDIGNGVFLQCRSLKKINISGWGNLKFIKQALLSSNLDFSQAKKSITISLKRDNQEDIIATINSQEDLENLSKKSFVIADGITLKENLARINDKKWLGSVGIAVGGVLTIAAFVFFAPVVSAVLAVIGAASLITGSIIVDKARENGNAQDYFMAVNGEENPDIKQLGKKSVAKDMQWRSWFKEAKKSLDVGKLNETLRPVMLVKKDKTEPEVNQ